MFKGKLGSCKVRVFGSKILPKPKQQSIGRKLLKLHLGFCIQGIAECIPAIVPEHEV